MNALGLAQTPAVPSVAAAFGTPTIANATPATATAQNYAAQPANHPAAPVALPAQITAAQPSDAPVDFKSLDMKALAGADEVTILAAILGPKHPATLEAMNPAAVAARRHLPQLLRRTDSTVDIQVPLGNGLYYSPLTQRITEGMFSRTRDQVERSRARHAKLHAAYMARWLAARPKASSSSATRIHVPVAGPNQPSLVAHAAHIAPAPASTSAQRTSSAQPGAVLSARASSSSPTSGSAARSNDGAGVSDNLGATVSSPKRKRSGTDVGVEDGKRRRVGVEESVVSRTEESAGEADASSSADAGSSSTESRPIARARCITRSTAASSGSTSSPSPNTTTAATAVAVNNNADA